jgi:hypothetical protein
MMLLLLLIPVLPNWFVADAAVDKIKQRDFTTREGEQ